ncbi:hypothetical protein FRC01_000324 [Tulasnella sp. 417]|nr:hypothetical protein FRC01_000324 [Tulasnella sp. 417]
MADTASMFFADEALRWHSKLPLDVRQDWFKLEEALVEKWYSPPDGQDNEPHIVPAAPAARVPQDKEKIIRFDHGIIKVIVEGSDTSLYMRWNQEDGDFIVTADSTHAARFRFDAGSSSRLLEYVVSFEIRLSSAGFVGLKLY